MMYIIDNSNAYEKLSRILENEDMGFFVVTASADMQREIAERYKTSAIHIYDFSKNTSDYTYSEIRDLVESNQETQIFFILNLQLPLSDPKYMFSFNTDVHMLAMAPKLKMWVFFMDDETDDHLSNFLFGAYVFVRHKVHFMSDED